MSTKMLGLILAGGKGTRLGKLTANQAKPAVPFGGRYRIIDFPLSNCANSGVHHHPIRTAAAEQPHRQRLQLGSGRLELQRHYPAAIHGQRRQQVV